MAGVEDEYGNVAVLHINTHDRPDVDVLPLGSLTPLAFRQASMQPETEQTALEWKSLGNTALKANSMQLARNYYSAGLARLNFKAYHRAGRAEYLLGNFTETYNYFEREVFQTGGSADALTGLQRAGARRAEADGRYDFEAIVAGLSHTHPKLNAASFLSKVDVMPSELHGRGLFANRDIVPGELVMCEKAISIVYGDLTRPKPVLKYLAHKKECKVTGNLAGAHRQLAKKLSDNPSLITKVLELYAGKDYDAETKELI
ncbi:unnamed protein product [Zymoseptoria tritici ST99CH_1E4]|uniref:Uncharacterized protein n=1 Tax=Zymoseptoria tritici ST99CH_1E4 TaxID=1276532 RepID=A0A2H1G5G0_ZYMTR|nr:unnamed protein product [Zymoseptoria tritici ST99CH_1E4]